MTVVESEKDSKSYLIVNIELWEGSDEVVFFFCAAGRPVAFTVVPFFQDVHLSFLRLNGIEHFFVLSLAEAVRGQGCVQGVVKKY